MNKTEIIQTQKTKDLEQEQLVGYWIKRYGITKAVLDRHPCADDIISLIKIREYLQQNKGFTNKSIDAKIGVMWQSVYNRKKALYPKHYTTLEKIVLEVESKIQIQANKKQQMVKIIQQARKGNG